MIPGYVAPGRAGFGAATYVRQGKRSIVSSTFVVLICTGLGYLKSAHSCSAPAFPVYPLGSLAALWHRFVLRDGVLARMWPTRAQSTRD